MNFINRYKKVLAVIAIVSFSFLTHVAAFPLKAETAAPAQQTVAASQDQPGAIEQGSPSGYYAKKKSSPIIPIIIGVVVVGAVVAVLVLVVLKTKYDIVGTWTFYFTESGYSPYNWNITFTGTKSSGSFTDEYDDYGIYSVVSKKNVTITYTDSWGTVEDWTMVGTFTAKNTMSGTFSYFDWWYWWTYSGTWTATKLTSAAAAFNPNLDKNTKGRVRK